MSTTSDPVTIRIIEGFVPQPYRELFHCFVPNRTGEDPDDHEHDFSVDCDWGFVCNQDGCTFRTDDNPCPDHAPKVAPPGWRLVECRAAEQLHYLLSHDRDDYGHGCPTCWAADLNAELKPLKMAAEKREHRWCWLLHFAKWVLCKVRLLRPAGYMFSHACWPHWSVKWRWSK